MCAGPVASTGKALTADLAVQHTVWRAAKSVWTAHAHHLLLPCNVLLTYNIILLAVSRIHNSGVLAVLTLAVRTWRFGAQRGS